MWLSPGGSSLTHPLLRRQGRPAAKPEPSTPHRPRRASVPFKQAGTSLYHLPSEGGCPMQPQLLSILESIEHDGTREFVRGVFEDLRRLLGYLDRARVAIGLGGRAAEAHFIFEISSPRNAATAPSLPLPTRPRPS